MIRRAEHIHLPACTLTEWRCSVCGAPGDPPARQPLGLRERIELARRIMADREAP